MGARTEPRVGRFEIDHAMKVRIVESLCIACGLCREVCPERAVHPKMQDIHHMYEVIESECTGCGDCLPYCPEPGALKEYEPIGIAR
jgi:NAD-dependent dihydropyrimidine dehydrogenase PreA subunit